MGRRERDVRPTISISWKNSVRIFCVLLPKVDLGVDWGRGQWIPKLHSPAALWVYLFYEIVQRCPDGDPELACPRDTAPVLWLEATQPSCITKPTCQSSQHGPGDGLVPSTPAHLPGHPTFSFTFHVLCTSKDKVAKSIRENRSACISKEEISVFLLVECLLFIFAPLSLRSHSRGCRGRRALGPSWVSVLPAPGTGTHPGPMGFLTKPHPHILQSLS